MKCVAIRNEGLKMSISPKIFPRWSRITQPWLWSSQTLIPLWNRATNTTTILAKWLRPKKPFSVDRCRTLFPKAVDCENHSTTSMLIIVIFPTQIGLKKFIIVSHRILLLHQAGLIDYANRRSVINHKRCTLSEIKQLKSKNPTALMMSDMVGIFVIFGTGITLGFLAFAIENVVAKFSKKK